MFHLHKSLCTYLRHNFSKSNNVFLVKRTFQTNTDESTSRVFKRDEGTLWKDKEVQKKFLDWFATEMNIKTLDDWYKIRASDVSAKGGKSLIEYNGSVERTVRRFFPEHTWHPWLFPATSRNWWSKRNHHLEFMNWFAQQKNIQNPEDWYKITFETIERSGGRQLRNHYKNLPKMLNTLYPEHTFLPWKFVDVPRNWWSFRSNQKLFLDWIIEQKQIKSISDWKNITNKQFIELGGSTLLNLYGSIATIVSSVYNENKQQILNNKSSFEVFNSICAALSIKKSSDWYNYTIDDIKKIPDAESLLTLYNRSLLDMLKAHYPTHTKWKASLFPKVLNGGWSNEQNVREYLAHIAKKKRVLRPQDWILLFHQKYRETDPKLSRICHLYGGWHSVLEKFMPEIWEQIKNTKQSKFFQSVERILHQIFIHTEIKERRVFPQIKVGGEPLMFNWYIKSKRLGFIVVENKNHPLVQDLGSGIELGDAPLREALEKKRIKLVCVPYWWNQSVESLKASIEKELSFSFNYKGVSQPIKTKEQAPIEKQVRKVLSFEQTKSEPVTDHNTYLHPVAIDIKKLRNPSGWWISRKIKGYRAIWSNGKLTLENGTVLNPPKKWLWGWPDIPMLGTLSIKRQFEKVLTDSSMAYWKDDVVFHAFELPSLDLPFEQRMQRLSSLETDRTSFKAVKMLQIQDETDYGKKLALVLHKGSGVIFRKPNSKVNEPDSFLQQQLFLQEKAEILTVGNASLVCKSALFGQLEVILPPTTEEAFREGDIIVYRYQGINSQNRPDDPTFIQKRFDLNSQLLIKNT